MDTNATYKANKLVLSKGWTSLGLDQKKPTCENPQIISISTWNNNMTIETNRTTQNELNVPYFQSSNDKNGKLHIGYVIIWQNIAKKVRRSLHIFLTKCFGYVCFLCKHGKVISFQIRISDYDLLVTVQDTCSILTSFHSLMENTAGFGNCIISSTTAILRLMEGAESDWFLC